MPTVRDLMSADLITVDPATRVMDAARRMFAGRAGSALVMEEGRLVGIFTERDIVRALSGGQSDAGRTSSVSSFMTAEPQTIEPDASVGEALDRMLTGGFRHLPVVEAGAVVGIVSMRDLAQNISKESAGRRRPPPRAGGA